METVLVIGATSSLAQAICRSLARKGYGLTLAGRDEAELELLAGDLVTRFGVTCTLLIADLSEAGFSAETFVEQAGAFDHIVIAVGDMGTTDAWDIANIAAVTHINYTVPAQIATACAERLIGKGKGNIVLISSVAGDRGRQSNIAYGSAKAALSTFASGLRNRLFKQGVRVMTVKPGFVDTPMTWGMNSSLIASREDVADAIVSAMLKKKNIVYVPWFWRWIILIIIHIPETIFKRLKL